MIRLAQTPPKLLRKYSPTSNNTPTDGQQGHRGTTYQPRPCLANTGHRNTPNGQPTAANLRRPTQEQEQTNPTNGQLEQANRPTANIGDRAPAAHKYKLDMRKQEQTNGQPCCTRQRQTANRGHRNTPNRPTANPNRPNGAICAPQTAKQGHRGTTYQPNGQNPANGHENGQQANGQPCCTHTNPARLLGHEGHRGTTYQPRPTSDGQPANRGTRIYNI